MGRNARPAAGDHGQRLMNNRAAGRALLRKDKTCGNRALDELIGELSREQEQAKRHELGRQAAKLLIDDVAAIFLFHQNGNVVHSKRIEGVYRFPSETHYIDERLKFAEGK